MEPMQAMQPMQPMQYFFDFKGIDIVGIADH